MVKHAVALIGLPGVGKTTIGQKLAHQFGVPFVDVDILIEERIGQKIRSYFEAFGEDAFREMEVRVLEKLLHTFQGVIATGGGAVLRPENRALLRTHALVIHLDAPVGMLYQRLRHDRQRPLLQVADPVQKLHDLKAQRHALYEEVAHWTFQVESRHMDTAITSMVAQLQRAGYPDLLKMMPDTLGIAGERHDADGVLHTTPKMP